MTEEDGNLNHCGQCPPRKRHLSGDLKGKKKLVSPGLRGHVFQAKEEPFQRLRPKGALPREVLGGRGCQAEAAGFQMLGSGNELENECGLSAKIAPKGENGAGELGRFKTV